MRSMSVALHNDLLVTFTYKRPDPARDGPVATPEELWTHRHRHVRLDVTVLLAHLYGGPTIFPSHF